MEVQAGMSAGPTPAHLDPSMQHLAVQKRQLIRELKASGRLQSATILNLNPFPLFVESGSLIQHRVKSATVEHPIQKFVITEPRFSYIYKSSDMTSQGKVQRRNYDVKEILPIIQAFEFFQSYTEASRDDTGGIVVFEGTVADIHKKGLTVKIPHLEVGEDNLPYPVLQEELLAVCIDRAMEHQKRKCMAMIQQAQGYADDPAHIANIQNPHRVWGRWAFAHHWVPELPRYVQQETSAKDFCPKCREQFKQGSIMCKCGHAFDVFKAYENAYIEFGNVQMDRMNPEEWKKAKLLNAERLKNRGA